LPRRTPTLTATALLIAAMCVAMPALASARKHRAEPRLLAAAPDDNSLSFDVRPATLELGPSANSFEFMVGPGATARAYNEDRPVGRIRWLRWAQTAVGRATDLHMQRNRLLFVHAKRSSQVTVRAWRVRAGRYSRLSITYPAGRTYVFALQYMRLPHFGKYLMHVWCRVGLPGCVAP
jgi:hypothetical protein